MPQAMPVREALRHEASPRSAPNARLQSCSLSATHVTSAAPADPPDSVKCPRNTLLQSKRVLHTVAGLADVLDAVVVRTGGAARLRPRTHVVAFGGSDSDRTAIAERRARGDAVLALDAAARAFTKKPSRRSGGYKTDPDPAAMRCERLGELSAQQRSPVERLTTTSRLPNVLSDTLRSGDTTRRFSRDVERVTPKLQNSSVSLNANVPLCRPYETTNYISTSTRFADVEKVERAGITGLLPSKSQFVPVI